MKATLLVIPLLLMPVARADDTMSARLLKQICDQGAGHPESDTLCSSYLAGVADGVFMAQVLTSQGSSTCLPSMPSGNEALELFQRLARQHPELLNLSAAAFASMAVSSAYPCKK
jgi:hypothetical protein